METMNGSWAGLLALGAFHGLNPGMGWLFAVALGMQERRRTAVWRAMLPLALGHALAIAAAIVVAVLVGTVVQLPAMQWGVGLVLLALGTLRFFRHGHPGGSACGVGMKDLTVVIPHGLRPRRGPDGAAARAGSAVAPHGMHHAVHAGAWSATWATFVHSAGYLSVSAVLALAVFEKFGVGLLRTAWLNLDLLWAITLVATSVATLMMA